MSDINYNLKAEDLRKCADKIISDYDKKEIEKVKNFLYFTLMPFLFKQANQGYYSYLFEVVRSKEDYSSVIFTQLDNTKIVSLKYLEKVLIDLGFFVDSYYLNLIGHDLDEIRILISWGKEK